MDRFCRFCGNKLKETSVFCRKCGKQVTEGADTVKSPDTGKAESSENISTANATADGNINSVNPVKIQPSSQEDTKFCKSCGKKVRAGAEFCNYCGFKTKKKKVQTPDPANVNSPVNSRGNYAPGGNSGVSHSGDNNVYRHMPQRKSFKPVIAFVLVVAILCVTLVKPGFVRTYLQYRLFSGNPEGNSTTSNDTGKTGTVKKSSGKGSKTGTENNNNNGTPQSVLLTASEDDWIEDRGDILLTQENSPGAVALIPIRYSESEIEAVTPLTATVNQDSTHAEVSTSRGQVTVDFWDWNLTETDDTLMVRELPVRTDSETGTEIVAYDFSMSSGIHEFMTSNHIRIPRTASENQECDVVWFDPELGRWEPAPFEYSEDGTCYDVYLDHFTNVAERKENEDNYYTKGKNGNTPFIEIRATQIGNQYSDKSDNAINPVKVTASSVKGYFSANQDLSHFLYDPPGESGNVGYVSDLYGVDSAISGMSKVLNVDTWTPASALQKKLDWKDPTMNKIGLGLVLCKVFYQYFNGRSFYNALKDNSVDLAVGATSVSLNYSPAITKWMGRKLIARWMYSSLGTSFFSRAMNYATVLGMKSVIALPVLAKAITIMCVLASAYSAINFIVGQSLPNTEVDPYMHMYQLYLEKVPVTVNGYSGLTIRNTQKFNEALLDIIRSSKTSDPEKMMEDIASLFEGYFNHFFNLSFEEQKKWYDSCKNRIYGGAAQASATAYNPKALEYKGISEKDKEHYIKVHSDWLHERADKFLQTVLWDDYEKMQVEFLNHLQKEVVPDMNRYMLFHVEDEALNAGREGKKKLTFDKSSYSRFSDEKSKMDYFNEHYIWFYMKNPKTAEREYITGPQFKPANRSINDYTLTDFQPYPIKDSDIVFACTKYHYLQMGAPDGIMFIGDDSAMMPDIPVDFTIPKSDDLLINVMITIKPEEIYGTWEVTTDMSDMNYGNLDAMVGVMNQAVGYMSGQASEEALNSMREYINEYQNTEDQYKNLQSKSTWIIRPTYNNYKVEIECDSGGQITHFDGVLNDKRNKLELKTSKSYMKFEDSEGKTYNLEEYGLYTTGTIEISNEKNKKTGKYSLKFEGEEQMKSSYANFKAKISGVKISDDY